MIDASTDEGWEEFEREHRQLALVFESADEAMKDVVAAKLAFQRAEAAFERARKRAERAMKDLHSQCERTEKLLLEAAKAHDRARALGVVR